MLAATVAHAEDKAVLRSVGITLRSLATAGDVSEGAHARVLEALVEKGVIERAVVVLRSHVLLDEPEDEWCGDEWLDLLSSVAERGDAHGRQHAVAALVALRDDAALVKAVDEVLKELAPKGAEEDRYTCYLDECEPRTCAGACKAVKSSGAFARAEWAKGNAAVCAQCAPAWEAFRGM
eukprot:2549112-Prymnesium_polylepis.2